MNEDLIDQALNWCVHNTPYSMYQYMRVIELISKWQDKTIYHLTKKQYSMYCFLMFAVKGVKDADDFLKELKRDD